MSPTRVLTISLRSGKASFKFAGRTDPICPTSGIVGNVIQQMICAQWTDEMVRRGSVPYYWMGFFQAGGRPYDDAIRPHFEAQGF